MLRVHHQRQRHRTRFSRCLVLEVLKLLSGAPFWEFLCRCWCADSSLDATIHMTKGMTRWCAKTWGVRREAAGDGQLEVNRGGRYVIGHL
jgi:hypothetical protein